MTIKDKWGGKNLCCKDHCLYFGSSLFFRNFYYTFIKPLHHHPVKKMHPGIVYSAIKLNFPNLYMLKNRTKYIRFRATFRMLIFI